MTIQTGHIALGQQDYLDLRTNYFANTTGNILTIGTWTLDDEEPCLVLVDAIRHFAKRPTIPCVIRLENAWRWTFEHGNPAWAWSTIGRWLDEGCLPGNSAHQRDMWAVMDAIQTRLRDMMMMPPMPAALVAPNRSKPLSTVGELSLWNGSTGAVLAEVEMKANVV